MGNCIILIYFQVSQLKNEFDVKQETNKYRPDKLIRLHILQKYGKTISVESFFPPLLLQS